MWQIVTLLCVLIYAANSASGAFAVPLALAVAIVGVVVALPWMFLCGDSSSKSTNADSKLLGGIDPEARW